MFSRVGAAAYKPGLERVEALDSLFGHPHRRYRTIHVAGTNGKGSVSHMLAAVLQANGYRTGLYTSPHLVDFRERMRVDGRMIPEEKVVDFVSRWKSAPHDVDPSFFELTMMMAFDWFAAENVDIAVIEVGMGGRLDSTNIISPLLSVITNISFDHMQFLGDTLPAIAAEKAGIIKPGIPVVIGEAEDEVENVFRRQAEIKGAPIIEAYRRPMLLSIAENPDWGWDCRSEALGAFTLPLSGEYQKPNINTVLNILRTLPQCGVALSKEKTKEGLENVVSLTGLRGRWTRLRRKPLAICDAGHNEAGLRYNLYRLARMRAARHRESKLRFVIGFVSDKDVDHILPMFPADAIYYVTNARIPRAMPCVELKRRCDSLALKAEAYPDALTAYNAALADASPDDIIYIGGSTFVVADLLSMASM